MTTTLTFAEAVALATAWADRFARQHGCRALVVKGSVLEAQGLRGHHESVDVDLMVDPAEFDRFVAALAEAGWHAMAPVNSIGIMDKHSATVLHEKWPITIDVHRFFPGFLADPQTVFEALWQRRTTAVVAGVDVTTPDPVGHAAIAALHYLRHTSPGAITNLVDPLAERTIVALGPEGLAELSAFAGQTGSARTLALFLEKVGAPPAVDDPALAEAYRNWEMNSHAAPSTGWLVGIGRQPVHKWPAVIWHALFLTDEEIAEHYLLPEHLKPGDTIFRARMRRLAKGLKNAPGALVYLVRFNLTHRRKR